MSEAPLICTVAIELSRSRWMIGALPPRSTKVAVSAVAGGDTGRLLVQLHQLQERLAREFEQPVDIKICFEAGYDGFWLGRFLRDRGHDVYVLDASSFLISRRGRRTKTDRVDVAAMTFTLRAYVAGDPSVCRVVEIPTPEAEDAKRLSRERMRLASERTRHVNRIRALLSLHGIRSIKGLWGGDCPHGNLTGISGRKWLARQTLPTDEHQAVDRHLSQIDQVEQSLKVVEADIAQHAMRDPLIQRLMTLPGVDMTVASGVAAAVGDIKRFAAPQKLVAYLGLNPSVRQSGEGPAYHGRITKQGRGQARGMLVEAAWAAARSPGPLRAFYRKIAARRGKHIAAVATARKLAMIVWHMLIKEADYIWARPALMAKKLRSVELRAGLPANHAKRGSAYDYNIRSKRAEERQRVEAAEVAYADFTERWRKRLKPKPVENPT